MRTLHARERAFLEGYFADALAYDRIRLGVSLGRRSWCPYGSRISLVRSLYVGSRAEAEVALDEPNVAAVFAHEALHVWQRQHGRAVTREGAWLQMLYALRLFDPYAYRFSRDPATLLAEFVLGNIEQQGRIFQDYVWADQMGRDTLAFGAVAAWVRGAPRLSQTVCLSASK